MPRPASIPNEEQELVDGIIEYCKLRPVRVHHGRSARTAVGYRTPIQGHPGFFDLVIMGEGGIIFAETKRRRGAKWQPGQKEWASIAQAAGLARVHVVVWTFADWPANGGGHARALIDLVARRPGPVTAPTSGDRPAVIRDFGPDAPGMAMTAEVRREAEQLRATRRSDT